MSNLIQPAFETEMSKIVNDITVVLSHLSQKESFEFLRLLISKVAQQRSELSVFVQEASALLVQKNGKGEQTDPSDIGAPPGAPKPVPVPPEVFEAAIRDFNDAEIVEAIQELRRDGGYELKDILPALETAIKKNATRD